MPIRVLPRLEIAPTVRFMYITRRQYLAGDNHRGPATGGGAVPGSGINIRSLIHGQTPAAAQRR